VPIEAELEAAQKMTPEDLKNMMKEAVRSQHYFISAGACEKLPDMTEKLSVLRDELGISVPDVPQFTRQFNQ